MEDLREGTITMKPMKLLDCYESREYDSGNRFCIVYSKDAFYDYERRILLDGKCSYILPVYLIEEEDSLRAYYDCEGCLLLKDAIAIQRKAGINRRWIENPVCDAVGILMNLLENLKRMEDHLMFPDRIAIGIDEVYVQIESGKVLLAYIPVRGKQTEFRSEIINLAEGIKKLYEPGEAVHFLNRFIQSIEENHPGLDGMISILGMIRREASYIYTVTENFRSNISGSNQESDPKGECGGISAQEKEALEQYREKKNWFVSFAKHIRYPCMIFFIMGAAILSGRFEPTQLAGLALIAAASGFWLIRRSRLSMNRVKAGKGEHAHVG